ncbi:ABC-F family ATP-binding cassette domain-containing protein [Pseudomonadota bacterium AL_CKDN230030165-1A_HGKHYDSX7]
MTNPSITLDGVTHVLPDGRTLFSDLNTTFDQRATGLVGRNGVGKSVLARILAGQLAPTHGLCMRTGTVFYLPQQVTPPTGATVAALAGAQSTLNALARIEAGSSDPADFDALAERWDIRQRLLSELEHHGLGHLEADTPASQLSGGEAMRVALAGAMLTDADFLILDEPSNHLDRAHRQALIDQLRHWQRGLIVISHDRQLLEHMAHIVELSSLGLRGYGGNYRFYANAKAQEHENALRTLDQRKLERRREEHAMREQNERQTRRQAQGHRHGKEANQAKILLGRQKERSEASAGKLRQQQSDAQQTLNQRVREAAQKLKSNAAISLHAIAAAHHRQQRVVELDGVHLPYVPPATRHIDLALQGHQRLGIVGPNGCGKSTLLRVIAGLVEPLAGTCKTVPGTVYLDQRLDALDPERTALAQLQAANPTASESDLRTRLAHLDLDAQKISVPSGSLSGGERLKAALACVLYADPPPPLLLLDEPSNHLDLASTEALEAMLRSYPGALIVVSHDDVFMGNLDLTDGLLATRQGWVMQTWEAE